MPDEFNPNRYAVIHEKNKREIVMLRGSGCTWRRCRFCDYHKDYSKDNDQNFALNSEHLSKVTGVYKKLEIINSGSFVDLDDLTMDEIETVALQRGINQLHFECHWNHRNMVSSLKARYAEKGICVKVKIGIETFDAHFRESYLDKGIATDSPAEIAGYFDECCLLQGLPGQTTESMLLDISTGLRYFGRVCINIMQDNSSPIRSDPAVIRQFVENIYPIYREDPRIDILLENTAFGVGGTATHAK